MNGPAAVTTTVKKKKWKVVILLVGGIVLLCIAGFFIYVSIYYHADTTAWEALPSDNDVTVTEQDGALIFAPQEPRAGFIFYPGGKVEYQAYSPLLHTLAKEGFLCIAVKMPFNLAVFNPTAADGWQERYPAIQRWYIGGHSLGGSMAAVYASQHSQQLEGLILLAAYSAEDLSQSGLQERLNLLRGLGKRFLDLITVILETGQAFDFSLPGSLSYFQIRCERGA